MLPGFRFLVAAIVFSVSVLVFGLGAAALFRAAHEQFASSSSWRATAEGSYTSFLPPAEPPRPVIAMLRIEPPVASARAPSSEPHTDLPSTVTPSAASTDTADAASAVVAAAPIEPVPAVAAQPADTPSANAAPTPAQDATTVASAAPPVTGTDVGETDMAKTEVATTEVPDAVPPAPPAPDLVTASAPKLDSPAPIPATSPSPVPTEPAVARQDVLPIFAEAQIPASVAVVTSDASNATPLPAPVASRSDLLAQMIALSADRATANDYNASIKTASLHLHQSLAKRRLAKERLAKERLAAARRARLHRQMAQRARAVREAAARQQQQQQQPPANPFAPPQAFAQPAFGQQAAQQTR
jgi:hypothetical protein